MVGSFIILAAVMSVLSYICGDTGFWYRIACSILAVVLSVAISSVISGKVGAALMLRLERIWGGTEEEGSGDR